MEFGADHLAIHANIYDVFTFDRTKLWGYCLYKKLEIIPECRTALIYLDRDELRQFHVQTGDTEGLVNFGLGLKDIVLSVLIIDRTERVKMSFRSKGTFPANEFAGKYFEGGGLRAWENIGVPYLPALDNLARPWMEGPITTKEFRGRTLV